MIFWDEDGYLLIARFRHGIIVTIAAGFNYFLDDLLDDEYMEEYFKPKDYSIAVKELEHLQYDECYGYVPLLCLGGPENVKNLEKVKLLEHLELILTVNTI